jgi:hypothetical protein
MEVCWDNDGAGPLGGGRAERCHGARDLRIGAPDFGLSGGASGAAVGVYGGLMGAGGMEAAAAVAAAAGQAGRQAAGLRSSVGVVVADVQCQNGAVVLTTVLQFAALLYRHWQDLGSLENASADAALAIETCRQCKASAAHASPAQSRHPKKAGG